MPRYMQGDIFSEAIDHRYDVAIVFGHLGLNEMALTWHTAQSRVPGLKAIGNPFESQDHTLMVAGSETRAWWFVGAENNHGMTDDRFQASIQALFERASKNEFKTIITNGIADVDHGISTNLNRASDDRRVRLIDKIMRNYEGQGFDVTLVSLNNAYTRNFA